MLIELGQFNTQTAIGLGVVDNVSNGTYNCASLTGSTAGLGNETGMASATIFENGSGTTTNTVNGKVSVSYRGVENPWVPSATAASKTRGATSTSMSTASTSGVTEQ